MIASSYTERTMALHTLIVNRRCTRLNAAVVKWKDTNARNQNVLKFVNRAGPRVKRCHY